MENTTKNQPKHQGRQVRHIRELLNFTQEEVAKRMNVRQQMISSIESSEEVSDEQLEKVAKALGVTADAIKNLDEEATVYNIVHNSSFSGSGSSISGKYYSCTFNPLDKLIEAMDEIKKLHKDLVKEKDEKIALLQKMLDWKK